MFVLITSNKKLGILAKIIILIFLNLNVFSLTYALDPTSKKYLHDKNATDLDFYLDKVQPIFVGRCVVCHSCTEAPCQLKMSSYEGVARGLSQENLAGGHLKSFLPSRLKDAKDLDSWRKRGYHSVLVSDPNSVENAKPPLDGNWHGNRSILHQAIRAGQLSNVQNFSLRLLDTYRLEKEKHCPINDQKHSEFLTKYPSAGMPLGLPALNDNEYNNIKDWLSKGAPGPSKSALEKLSQFKYEGSISEWEKYLNEKTTKKRLIAKYIFEHMANVHFSFKEVPGDFFELIRSHTSFPEPISEIVTDLPSSNPNKTEFIYRFKKITEAIVKKTHIVWSIDKSELSKIEKLFGSLSWEASDGDVISYTGNPFVDFKSIPAEIRSRFMLKHSQLMIDQMVRGTVCVGPVATYAIRDHFWVSFLAPQSDPSVKYPDLSNKNFFGLKVENKARLSDLDRPAIEDYQNNFEYYLQKMHPIGLNLDDLWQERGNSNSRLTIFRHENTASVHQGWVGGVPKTAWVLSYSNFERLFYNLVVDFKYWGSLKHRALTWDMMHEIRLEGEELFVTLLPMKYRWQVRNQWEQGTARHLLAPYEKRSRNRESQVQIEHRADEPVKALFEKMNQYYLKTQIELDDRLNLKGEVLNDPFENLLQSLTKRNDLKFAQFLPSVMYVRVSQGQSVVKATGSKSENLNAYSKANSIANSKANLAAKSNSERRERYYTLIVNRAFANHDMPLIKREAKVHVPGEDELIAFEGLISSHPFQIFDLDESNHRFFLTTLADIRSEEDFQKFKLKFSLQRNDQKFWKIYDEFVTHAYRADPINAGLIDLNQYDNGSK